MQMHVTGGLNSGQFYDNDFTEFLHLTDEMFLSMRHGNLHRARHLFPSFYFIAFSLFLAFSIAHFVRMHAKSKVLVFVFLL